MGSLEEALLTGFLCRLCSKMHRSVIHIYGEEGLINRLEYKINRYLPVTIASTDPLPKTICSPCLVRLDHHHKLLETVNMNTLKLKKIYEQQARLLANQQRTAESTSQTNSTTSSTSSSSSSINSSAATVAPSTSSGSSNTSSNSTSSVKPRTSKRLKAQRDASVRSVPYRKCAVKKSDSSNINKRRRKK